MAPLQIVGVYGQVETKIRTESIITIPGSHEDV
jgi:hypothetical protein